MGREQTQQAPLRLTGILFALFANVLGVTLATLLIEQLNLQGSMVPLTVAIFALIAGVWTVLYIKRRGGIHAFIGGMLTIPLAAFISLDGNWQLAIYAGLFCAFGGLLFERFGPDRYRPARRQRSTD